MTDETTLGADMLAFDAPEPKSPRIMPTFRSLMAEYRPSMDSEVLHSWAADVTAVWHGSLAAHHGSDDMAAIRQAFVEESESG